MDAPADTRTAWVFAQETLDEALADYVARRQREEGAANPDQAVGEARIILEFLHGPEVADHKMRIEAPRVMP